MHRSARVFGRKIFLLAMVPVMLGILTVSACRAQAAAAPPAIAATTTPAPAAVPDWQTAAGGKMEFDVASVKQNKTDDKPTMNFPLGPGDVYVSTNGVLSATNMPLIVYLAFAYKITGNQWPTLQKQLPGWVTTDKFDIDAKSDNHDATKDQMRLMMQALLADRFKLVVHTESRESSVFALVVAKPGKLGPNLQVHPADAVCSTTIAATAMSQTAAALPTVAGGYPATCGGVTGVPTTGIGRYAFGARNVTIASIASIMGGAPEIGRPVIDQTGLTGTYDFRMEFTPESTSAASSTDAPAGVTLIEALQEQLGLKLVPEKHSFDVFVVDHVEHPSAN